MRKLGFVTGLCALAVSLGTSGCKGDDPIMDGTGGGDDGGGDDGGDDGDAGCLSDDDCASYEICEAEECIDGDRNNSVDEAETVLWDDSVSGTINPSGDVDYFTFTADGGEYVRIESAHEDDNGDTVLVLRGPSGKVHASADEHATGGGVTDYDSMLYAYLDEAGDYTISIEDVSTYYGSEPQYGSPNFAYEITLNEFGRHTVEDDAQDSPNVSVTVEVINSWYTVGTLIQEDGDSDWVQVVLEQDGAELRVDGMSDLGASSATPLVRIYDTDGTLIAEKASVGPEDYVMYPSLPRGTYSVELTDENGAGASDAWYFAFILAMDPAEQYVEEIEPNDVESLATEIALTETDTDNGNLYSYGNQQGYADTAGDVDWFVVEQPYDEATMILCLNGAPYGSLGVQDIAIYDDTGELLASVEGDENLDPTAVIDDLTVGPGTYYYAVTNADDAVGSIGEWYRIVTYLAEFVPSSYSCP